MAFGESFAWHQVKKHWKSSCSGANQASIAPVAGSTTTILK